MNKLFLSNQAILIAGRDFFQFDNFRCKVMFKNYHSLNYLSNV